MKKGKEAIGTGLIVVAFITTIAAFFIIGPVPQDLAYHQFSDTEGFLNLPNALNVLSNVPFIVVGIAGLVSLSTKSESKLNVLSGNRMSYYFLFIGAAMVGFGSGYYHLNPTNESLVWDRLPMTIAFMGLYSIIIGEFVSEKLGKILLVPLSIAGVGSVLYWWFTEASGAGDLRYYAVVQFFPILTIPVILICYRPKFSDNIGYWVLILSYVGAKVVETFDSQIHGFLVVMSGHTIKHVLPALGLCYLIAIYRKRRSI